MRRNQVTSILVVLALSILFIGLIQGHSLSSTLSAATSPHRAVVVELFTSEGCSSCPPADALLKTFSERQSVPDVEVIALEEHVDYWDHLGWKDPFSSSQFTERQTDYSHLLKDGGVYTPQLVIDGQTVVVGGRSSEAAEAIQKAAAQPKADIQLTPSAGGPPEKTAYDIKITNLAALPQAGDIELWIAVTEKNLQNDVKAGENSGSRLQHAAVVRSIWKLNSFRGPADYISHTTVKLQKTWQRENLAIVAFAVEKKSHKIVGASSIPIAPTSTM
jgi:hypothetical protein